MNAQENLEYQFVLFHFPRDESANIRSRCLTFIQSLNDCRCLFGNRAPENVTERIQCFSYHLKKQEEYQQLKEVLQGLSKDYVEAQLWPLPQLKALTRAPNADELVPQILDVLQNISVELHSITDKNWKTSIRRTMASEIAQEAVFACANLPSETSATTRMLALIIINEIQWKGTPIQLPKCRLIDFIDIITTRIEDLKSEFQNKMTMFVYLLQTIVREQGAYSERYNTDHIHLFMKEAMFHFRRLRSQSLEDSVSSALAFLRTQQTIPYAFGKQIGSDAWDVEDEAYQWSHEINKLNKNNQMVETMLNKTKGMWEILTKYRVKYSSRLPLILNYTKTMNSLDLANFDDEDVSYSTDDTIVSETENKDPSNAATMPAASSPATNPLIQRRNQIHRKKKHKKRNQKKKNK